MPLSAGVGRAAVGADAGAIAAELWKSAGAGLAGTPRALILFSPFSGSGLPAPGVSTDVRGPLDLGAGVPLPPTMGGGHARLVAELGRLSGDCPLIGGTTYGGIRGPFLEEEAHVLLALAGDVHAALGLGTRLAHDSFSAGRQAAEQARAGLRGQGRLLILLHEPQMGDCSLLVEGARSVLGPEFPIVGGGTGTGLLMEQSPVSKQFLGKKVFAGSCAAMLLGGDFRCSFSFSHGAVPVGRPFTLTKARGNILVELDGRPALDLLEETLGVDCSSGIPFAAFSVSCGKLEPEEGAEDFPLLGFWGADRARRNVLCGTPIEEGRRYVFVRSLPNAIVEDSRRAALRAVQSLKGRPRAALAFDCYGRKIQLGAQGLIEAELKALQEAVGEAPLAGMYSGSEIGVLRGARGAPVSRYTHAATSFAVLGD